MTQIQSQAAGPIMQVADLEKHFVLGRKSNGRPRAVHAVDGVSFDLRPGETLGVVGESGCGKSTLARVLIRLLDPTGGQIRIKDRTVGTPGGMTVKEMRKLLQMVFQDSFSSLNPRMTIQDTIAFGLRHQGRSREEARERTRAILEQVGLPADRFGSRYPHELSGGQRQRVNIARALALDPEILILDEAVSALDKSVEAQVINLLSELKSRLGLTYIFISHDLHIVRYFSDRVLVMYLGRVIEIGEARDVYTAPCHPYTRALLSAMPSADPARRTEMAPITGDPPNPIDPPSGCRFRTRCPHADARCASETPVLEDSGLGDGHQVACHHFEAILKMTDGEDVQ
ncbi:ABC transporter ATP-binding protein [Pacificispira sp.]|uniref:ABC transporter ATP-binding protein n=1 Tax=Pacificispira sp. TaxID=2888761 RepID=UPI003BA97F83